MRTLQKTIHLTTAFALLATLAACAPAQPTPTMLDYSYIPPAHVIAPQPSPGIDDF